MDSGAHVSVEVQAGPEGIGQCRTTIEMSGLSKVEMSSFAEVKEGMENERGTDIDESARTGCVAGDGAGDGG